MNVHATAATRWTGAGGDTEALTWQVHSSLEAAAPVWRSLERLASPKVFQTHAWVNAWYQRLGATSGVEPRIVVACIDGQPCLLLPLGLHQRFGLRQLTWLGASWNDYNAPIFTDTFARLMNETEAAGRSALIQQVWTDAAAAAGGADFIELPKQTPIVNGGRPNPLFDPAAPPADNAAHLLDLNGNETEVMAALHSPKTWKGYSRKEKKLASQGKLAFTELTAEDEKAAAVEHMLVWKRQELDDRGASNPFTCGENIAFLADVARLGPDVSRIFAYTLDGAPIAVALCLPDHENLVLYQTAYDREHGRNSPGTLLFHKLIALAAREGFATFDLAFGDDAYKANLCNRTVTLSHTTIALTALGAVACLASSATIAGRRAIKRNPALLRMALQMNRMFGGLVTARS